MKKKTKHDRAEIAESIVRQSKKVARSYARFENALFKVVMVFSSFIDKILFNRHYSKVVALVLALLMYMTVNAGSMLQLSSGITSSKSASGVPVTVLYNDETFELSGMPDSVDVTFTGDATSVTSAANADGRIVADLEGLTEGTHNVRLTVFIEIQAVYRASCFLVFKHTFRTIAKRNNRHAVTSDRHRGRHVVHFRIRHAVRGYIPAHPGI